MAVARSIGGSLFWAMKEGRSTRGASASAFHARLWAEAQDPQDDVNGVVVEYVISPLHESAIEKTPLLLASLVAVNALKVGVHDLLLDLVCRTGWIRERQAACLKG